LPFEVANLYGVTEATIWSTAGAVSSQGESAPSIGRPVANVRVYVLDARGEAAPIGVPGELCIAGAGVGRGYLGRPALTAERFVPDPFSETPGARLYRSGDVARWLPDGSLAFLERSDHQVKLRGYRIELGEIEVALMREPEVAHAVVVAREDSPGNKRLVAYYVAASSAGVHAASLRDALARTLPEYMLPSAFVALESLPLTPSGKIDRRALPPPTSDDASHLEPATPTEETIAALWAASLGLARVGRLDDFFAIGGHSLKAAEVVARVSEAFDCDIAISLAFEQRVLADFARAVDAARGAAPMVRDRPVRGAGRASGEVPIGAAEEARVRVERLAPGRELALCSVAIAGPLRVDLVEPALELVARRHEVLRTTYTLGRGRVTAAIADGAAGLPWTFLEAVVDGPLADASLEAAPPAIDIFRGPVFRARLVRHDSARHDLLVAIHHVAADATAVWLFVRDFAMAYESLVSGEAPRWPELPIEYSDYLVWRTARAARQRERGAAWLQQLPPAAGGQVALMSHVAGEAVRLSAPLPRVEAERLEDVARALGCTESVLWVAALVHTLSHRQRDRVMCLGFPLSNRELAELRGIVGSVADVALLRIELAGDFRELVARTKAAVHEALEGRGIGLTEMLKLARDHKVSAEAFHPRVAFNFVANLPPMEFDVAGLRMVGTRPLPRHAREAPQFDLGVLVHHSHGERDAGRIVQFTYDKSKLEEHTVNELLAEYLAVLGRCPAT
jgi:hypothetical protein